MNVKAVIHEQIEWDGTDKAFQMQSNENIGDIWIAFPPDYDDERNTPFYFLDEEYQTIFLSEFASSGTRKLPKSKFYNIGKDFFFKTNWYGIPTSMGEVTYYAFYFPEFAIPTEIKITGTFNNEYEFSKNVLRDDQKNRFVVYLECKSNSASFDFNIFCIFHHDSVNFSNSEYRDDKTVDFYVSPNHWEWKIPKLELEKVNNLFLNNNIHYMGDQHNYHINQAGAVGPNSTATNNTFNQQNISLPANLDFQELSKELTLLKSELIQNATSAEHYQAIAELTHAENASKEKNSSNVVKHLLAGGKWVFDFATKVGVSVVAEIIKSNMK